MIGTDIAEDGGVDKGVEGETDVCSKIQDRDKDGQTSDEDPAFKKRLTNDAADELLLLPRTDTEAESESELSKGSDSEEEVVPDRLVVALR